MEYLKHKKTGIIYAIRGYGYANGKGYHRLQQRGSTRTTTIADGAVKQSLKAYKPGFFMRIKLFFEFI